MSHEPKRRHSTERKGQRRAAIKLTAPKAVICTNCGTPMRSHEVCKNCGYYKGKEVVKKHTPTSVRKIA